MLGTICQEGPNVLGAVCSKEPIVLGTLLSYSWGPNIQGNQMSWIHLSIGTKCPGTKSVRDQMYHSHQNLCISIIPIIQILTSKIDIFFRGFKTTGPFVTMIYRMVANDLFRFCIVFFIFVMGFGQCNMIFLIINLRSGWNFEKSNILFTFF